MVADEVGANDEQVEATMRIALNARQQAAQQINDLFGLNVSVDYYNQPEPADEAPGEEFAGGSGAPVKEEEA